MIASLADLIEWGLERFNENATDEFEPDVEVQINTDVTAFMSKQRYRVSGVKFTILIQGNIGEYNAFTNPYFASPTMFSFNLAYGTCRIYSLDNYEEYEAGDIDMYNTITGEYYIPRGVCIGVAAGITLTFDGHDVPSGIYKKDWDVVCRAIKEIDHQGSTGRSNITAE